MLLFPHVGQTHTSLLLFLGFSFKRNPKSFLLTYEQSHWALLIQHKVPADCLFNVVRSLDSLGQTLLEIPSIEETNCVSLHLGTDGNRVVREICFDNSGSSMLVTSEDVITSVRALSIDSHEDTSFLTVTYVMHPVSSSSQAQQNLDEGILR